MRYDLTFTNLHQFDPAQLAALHKLLEVTIGVRVANPDATVTAEVTLAESGVTLRGIPALYTNLDLELFLPCCDGTLRVAPSALSRLVLEVDRGVALPEPDRNPPTCMVADVVDFVQAELQLADTVVVQIGEAKWRVAG